MTRRTAQEFGRVVVGPLIAEFSLRLWLLTTLLDDEDSTALLFCARGGLRMQLAYERFLAASGLPTAVHRAPLMVSRVVAMRSSIARALEDDQPGLLPGASRTLGHEFGNSTVGAVAKVLSEQQVPDNAKSSAPMTSSALHALLQDATGAPARDALREQADLFARHLHEAAAGRPRVILVDTGLHGTTALLLAEAFPELSISSALIANYYPPTRPERSARTFGLSMEADGYAPLWPRRALLRYWHFVEWLFEPELPTVRQFVLDDDRVRSNLELENWASRVDADPDSVLAGVLEHLDGLTAYPAQQISRDAPVAWRRFQRTVVFPGRAEAHALQVSERSHDFGREDRFGVRPWRGVVQALRGAAIWREGEIARAGTPLRLPLLAMVEGGYGARWVARGIAGRTGSARSRLRRLGARTKQRQVVR